MLGVTVNIIGEGGILDNAEKAVDMSKVNAVKNEIKLAIAKKMIVSDRDVTIGQIIEQLEKLEIINSGDSNVETGQVKTQPNGYVYEIKKNEYNEWEVTYIGTGKLIVPDAVIMLSKNTTGITDKVTITMKATSESGIASYTLPAGKAQSVANGTTEMTKTYVATSNGTYTFTVVNGEGKTVTKSITIDNILEETIEISANTTLPTANNVIVTITWPKASNQAVKQIQVGEGIWQTVTGSASQVTVTENCTVKARVKNSVTDIISNSITIDNIDKTKATVIATAETEAIDWQASKEISDYFTVEANGTTDVVDIKYINTSNGNVEVENTNTLEIGTHIIKCTATKETGVTSSATIAIEVEPLVYGSLYKISDTEYHLIFNGTGALAEGYSESQLVVKGENIKDGVERIEVSEGKYKSNQPWADYTENIKKVKIEEKLKPRRTTYYFRDLTQITEIEGLNDLDTSNVTNMQGMFYDCNSLVNLDLSSFNTSNVTNMQSMFEKCRVLTNIDVSSFDTSNVTNMKWMFLACNNLSELDIRNFNTISVNNMQAVFAGCNSLSSLDLKNFNTSNVTNMQSLFELCNSLTNLDISTWNTSNVTNMNWMFLNCNIIEKLDLNNFNTENVTTMKGMFDGCNKLSNLNISNFNTSNVTDMHTMFYACSGLTNLDLSNFDTKNVTDMGGMFNKCSSLVSLNISSFNTSKVTNMQSMFESCETLTNLDLSNFNTSNVTNMKWMFIFCNGLTSLNISNFNTSNVTDMQGMFCECSSLTNLDISNFNTSNVTNMKSMFEKCTALTSLDLSKFNTGNVTNMQWMFLRCSSLKKIYAGTSWTTTNVTTGVEMFYGCTVLSGAITYSETANKIGLAYANWTTGYLTYKEN